MKTILNSVAAIALAFGVTIAPMLAPLAQASTTHAAVRQESTSSDVLTAEALANMEYQSALSSSGVALLSNGVYTESVAPDSASVTTVYLLPEPVAYGELNGQEAAAVLIAENGGGSGTFISLAVVVNQDGVPVNIATSMLGDRVAVNSMIIEENQIIVAMTAHGPDDPMCCPSQPVIEVYSLIGNALSLDSQLFVTLDVSGVAETYTVGVMPATPYDESMPPGPQGAPSHIVVTFDGVQPNQVSEPDTAFIAIYPATDYAALWEEAGNSFITDSLNQLASMLEEQPANPEPPLPILPPPAAHNDVAVQVAYLDSPFMTGMRFVGRVSQDASPLLASQLDYYFDGLNTDGSLLVAAQLPVTTEALPADMESMSDEMKQQFDADPIGFIAAQAEMLDELEPSDFSPDLTALDAMMESLNMEMVANPLSLQSLGNMAYQSEMTAEGEAILVNGVYTESVAPGSASFVSVTLLPQPIAYGDYYGLPAAAVLIAENSGGSGTFINLALVVEINGAPVNIATTLLGDRVVVNDLTFNDNTIGVDMISHGPNDPLCCPTQQTIQVYEMGLMQMQTEGETDAASDAQPERTTPELAGTSWTWSQTQMMDDSSVTPADPSQFTLLFNADGAFATQTDCNTFQGNYSADSSTGQLAMETTISTRMACPPEALEESYIRSLNGAASYLVEGGNLYIALKMDSGIMEFAPIGE
jgi:heat shock protein HslJ